MSNARITRNTEQVVVRLPRALMDWVREDAKVRGCTLTNVIAEAVQRLKNTDVAEWHYVP